MKNSLLTLLFILMCTLIITRCTQKSTNSETANADSKTEDTEAKDLMNVQTELERGRYLVAICGCDDCHSPKIMTAQGPVIDSTRRLSGHPADTKLAAINPAELAPGKWFLAGQDLTSWVGPWGVSFPVNLTPDSATGTGAWTPELFIKIIRTGKFMGIESGRDILPPMPWQNYRQMTDDDLKAIFAYLKSLPPVSNLVPEPLPPPAAKKS